MRGSVRAAGVLLRSSLILSSVGGWVRTLLLILLYPGPQSRDLRLRMVSVTGMWSEKWGGEEV